MVRGYHSIFSTYGFWLPNDPRGSWSDWIRNWELLQFGSATKTESRRSVAKREHDRSQRHRAKQSLRYPPVHFTGPQALAVARGFRQVIDESSYVVHACAILPEHVHLVIARHERTVERIIAHLKGRATQQLKREDLHPLRDERDEAGNPPTPWGQGTGWKVFLNTPADIRRSIRYVEKNPPREGKPPQQWSFITPYESR